MSAHITAIEYFLPKGILSNEQLAEQYIGWSAEKIEKKTGIRERHIAAENECSSDLGVAAAEKLLRSGVVERDAIDYLIFCTQSPDYFLPTTACVMQHRLGLPKKIGALDINLGCSGFIYGLGLAKGLIETAQSKNVLLVTAETYSKFIHLGDKSVRTLFGDAAAATLVQFASDNVRIEGEMIGPFVYGTDGSGKDNLIVPTGGMRRKFVMEAEPTDDGQGNTRTINNLYMNGGEIFQFTLDCVSRSINELLVKSRKEMNDIDLFVFHQANRYILDHLKRKLEIPSERFHICVEKVGNTVSSSIPIAMKDALDKKIIKSGNLLMLVGFGVGYSWGSVLVRWP